MTYRVDISEAQGRLLDLIRAAEQGEEVLITENQQPVVQLVPVAVELARPRFGSARGRVQIREDFDAPLDTVH
ncbi:MAG: type II toxin-antitoxin system prevent-host-death family antitoxin [Chloroflexaceae bacterium]|jgi:prevent-host-death family protein|nr:type II toxin-antitoxin system prevent-host-death family antitoxin [Chloroflexaceae bacterium]